MSLYVCGITLQALLVSKNKQANAH